ncbi:MAG: hypothetical protein U0Z44_12955 [Kouleothrix sp.]
MSLRIAIVGCGLIGQKRARALGARRLVAVADTNVSAPACWRPSTLAAMLAPIGPRSSHAATLIW